MTDQTPNNVLPFPSSGKRQPMTDRRHHVDFIDQKARINARLIIREVSRERSAEAPEMFFDNLSWIIEEALVLVLHEFDYFENPRCARGEACRVLSTVIYRLNNLRVDSK